MATPGQVGMQQASQSAGPPTGQPQTASPKKEVNTAHLCRLGQEHVQDTVQKVTDLFQMMKQLQLPNGMNPNMQQHYQDRKNKLKENSALVTQNFKKLRICYDKVLENTAGLDDRPVEELLPIEENGEVQGEKPRVNDATKYISEEHRKTVDEIRLKNQQLKDIIDKQRKIVWEINTMTAMRK